jgi:hypothetical protein
MNAAKARRPKSAKLAYKTIDHASRPLPVIAATMKKATRIPTHHQAHPLIKSMASLRRPGQRAVAWASVLSPEPSKR